MSHLPADPLPRLLPALGHRRRPGGGGGALSPLFARGLRVGRAEGAAAVLRQPRAGGSHLRRGPQEPLRRPPLDQLGQVRVPHVQISKKSLDLVPQIGS